LPIASNYQEKTLLTFHQTDDDQSSSCQDGFNEVDEVFVRFKRCGRGKNKFFEIRLQVDFLLLLGQYFKTYIVTI